MSVTYDVYAQQLFRLGQGYPLWEPEPKDGIEVEIGDVGYLHRGGFYRIFNALRDPQDPLNATLGTPPDFEKFSSGAMQPHRVENAIASGPVASKTLRKISVTGELSVHNIGATCKYECTDDQGALLVLETPAVREELHQLRRLKNYFSKNINDWHTFAAGEIGLEKKPEEILFVRGWVKTTRWAVAAFTNQAKSAKISFDGNFASPATASFALEASESIAPQHDRRSGPEDRLRGEGHHHARIQQQQHQQRQRGRIRGQGGKNHNSTRSSEGEPAWPADQCVFLHYLKLKKRFLLLKTIEAAAEPQDPSVSGDDDDTIEEVPARIQIQDPVDEVLDYILRRSQADMAIASDRDLIDLCKQHNTDDLDFPIPADVTAFLERVQPPIEVTEEGLGMLVIEEHVIPAVPVVPEAGEEAGRQAPVQGDVEMRPAQPRHYADYEEGLDEETRQERRDGKTIDRKLETTDTLLELSNDEHRGGVCALAYAPNGLYIAAGFEDSSVVVWNANNRRRLHDLRGHNEAICSLEFSPNSQELVSGSRDSRVIVWSMVDGSQQLVLSGHTGFVNSVAFSPTQPTIASASVDFTVRLWNSEDGTARTEPSQHDAMVMFVAFSPDGTKLVSASADCVARLWNTEDGSRVADLDTHDGVIYSVAFSPDSRRIVTSSDDGSARIWSSISGDEFICLREHAGSVWTACFSADGKEILSVASERAVKVCDSYSGDLIRSIEGGDALVNAATFSPKGDYLGAGGEDHSVNVWDTKTGVQIASFSGHTDNINRLRFSQDGKRIVSSSDDSTVRLFHINLPPLSPKPQRQPPPKYSDRTQNET